MVSSDRKNLRRGFLEELAITVSLVGVEGVDVVGVKSDGEVASYVLEDVPKDRKKETIWRGKECKSAGEVSIDGEKEAP